MAKPIENPDPHDINDPRYYMKYAHTVPPPAAYYFIPNKKDNVAHDDDTMNERKVHFGWNNIT